MSMGDEQQEHDGRADLDLNRNDLALLSDCIAEILEVIDGWELSSRIGGGDRQLTELRSRLDGALQEAAGEAHTLGFTENELARLSNCITEVQGGVEKWRSPSRTSGRGDELEKLWSRLHAVLRGKPE
jgi:hypothetical protein